MSQSPQQRDERDPGASVKRDGASRRIPLRDKKITFTLGLPRTIFGALFLVFILIWVFIFGIILGRGHNPEDVVPELAKVMPSPSVPADPADNEGMNDVLKPQDLKYHDTLKKNEPTPAPTPTPQPQQPLIPAPGSPPQKTAPTPKPQEVKPATAATQATYNYIYQVAAFNNMASAQNMQKKLQKSGFSTRIEQGETRGTTWYRVLVLFKGKQEETRGLKTKLTPYGISTIILRGKTSVK